MKTKFFGLGLVTILILLPATMLLADSTNSTFTELKARSLTIRNTDLQLRQMPEWLAIAKNLAQWGKSHPNRPEAPDALFSSAVMWRILYRGTKEKSYFEAAQSAWLRLAEEYPDSRQADEALLKIGELYWIDLNDQSTGRVFFERVLREYPGTDSAVLANQKLNVEDSIEVKESSEQANSDDAQVVIVLDPGHGGEDLGAVASSGLLEKDIVLITALELERLLNERLPVKVVMTRRSDVFVPLAARTQLANDNAADLFVSIHINSSETGRPSGLEVYYLDNTDNKASQKLAERENASMAFEGQPDDLQLIMSDMIQNAKLDDSIELAKVFDKQLTSFLSERWPGIRSLGVKKAPFYVLVGAHMPCVLVELFFINHTIDGANLIKRSFRHDLAEGLYRGIEHYLSESGKITK